MKRQPSPRESHLRASAPSATTAGAISAGVLLISCGLLFANLGHYDFWGDEADTFLFAQGIVETGDLSAMHGHNVYAYRNGALLENLRNRATPPFPYYLEALFLAIGGQGTFVARLPFALCGLALVGLLLYWLWHDKADRATWILMAIGLTCNASLFLNTRQCRYYALAMLTSAVIAYLYLHWRGKRITLIGFVTASIVLLTTHYLAYAALVATLAVDYCVWQRHTRRLSGHEWAILLVPQIIAGLAVVAVWNPLGKMGVSQETYLNPLVEKAILLWWNLRDLNACEYGAGLLMLAAPLVYLRTRNLWLLRAPVALAIYVLVVTLGSPQPVSITSLADIRYLTPLIPLCIWLTVIVVRELLPSERWAIVAALAIFGVNVANHPLDPQQWRSSPLALAYEIIIARPTATSETAAWIREAVKPGESIVVSPDHMMYGLMVHAPHALYAWQFTSPPSPQARDLPPIHVWGELPPDHVISFGPVSPEVEATIAGFQQQGIGYKLTQRIDIYADDMIRPELFVHAFTPIVDYDRNADAVYVFSREGR